MDVRAPRGTRESYSAEANVPNVYNLGSSASEATGGLSLSLSLYLFTFPRTPLDFDAGVIRRKRSRR